MVTGSAPAWVDGSTVHRTRMVAPPPLPASLHWVIVALGAAPAGLQETVGAVPPPAPDPLHWLMVAGDVAATPVMLLMMRTVHVTLPPPPLPEPSQTVTEVVRSVGDEVVDVVQGSAELAGPWHSLTVTEVLVAPVATLSVLVTVTSHSTPWPPTLSEPLHRLTATFAAAACGTSAVCQETMQTAASSRSAPTRVARREVADARRAAGWGACASDGEFMTPIYPANGSRTPAHV